LSVQDGGKGTGCPPPSDGGNSITATNNTGGRHAGRSCVAAWLPMQTSRSVSPELEVRCAFGDTSTDWRVLTMAHQRRVALAGRRLRYGRGVERPGSDGTAPGRPADTDASWVGERQHARSSWKMSYPRRGYLCSIVKKEFQSTGAKTQTGRGTMKQIQSLVCHRSAAYLGFGWYRPGRPIPLAAETPASNNCRGAKGCQDGPRRDETMRGAIEGGRPKKGRRGTTPLCSPTRKGYGMAGTLRAKGNHGCTCMPTIRNPPRALTPLFAGGQELPGTGLMVSGTLDSPGGEGRSHLYMLPAALTQGKTRTRYAAKSDREQTHWIKEPGARTS